MTDLPSGTNLVCPRCGTAAGDAVWCEGCGLNLKKQDELPTGDAYAARKREERWLADKDEEARKQTKAQQAKAAQEEEQAQKARQEARKKQAAEREARRRKRRDWIRSGKPWLIAGGVGLVAVIALLVGWHVTEWDAPLVGQSPVLTADAEEDEGSVSRTSGSEDGGSGAAPAGGDKVFVVDNLEIPLSEPTTLLIGNHLRLVNIVWTGWGSATANGEGTISTVDCTPSCAEGSIITEPVTITLSELGTCDGQSRYTHIRAVSESTQPFAVPLECPGSPAGMSCGDIQLAPNTDNSIADIMISGGPDDCDLVRQIISDWTDEGYPSPGPAGFTCTSQEGSTGLASTEYSCDGAIGEAEPMHLEFTSY